MHRIGLSLAVLASSWVQGGCDAIEVHAVPGEPFSCENEAWNEARINPHRYIAHAGGQIDGRRYTNSREALDLAYENGLRLFEFDLIKTSDGRLVAAHFCFLRRTRHWTCMTWIGGLPNTPIPTWLRTR